MFLKSAKFLVVDDFSTMRKIVRKVLEELGYSEIEEADDGRSGYDLLQAAVKTGKSFDCVISDGSMPGMTGLQFLIACRKDINLNQMPFILVTADSEEKNILEAARAGVSDFIVKPFNAELLKAKLEKVWKKHNPDNDDETPAA